MQIMKNGEFQPESAARLLPLSGEITQDEFISLIAANLPQKRDFKENVMPQDRAMCMAYATICVEGGAVLRRYVGPGIHDYRVSRALPQGE